MYLAIQNLIYLTEKLITISWSRYTLEIPCLYKHLSCYKSMNIDTVETITARPTQ